MTHGCPRPHRRWHGAIGVLARGKRASPVCAPTSRARRAVRSIGGEKPKAKGVTRPFKPYRRRVQDESNPVSSLQSQSGPAPQIELLEQQTAQAGDTVRLAVRITDTGGGIGKKVVWRVNGRTQGELNAAVLAGQASASLSNPAILTQGLRVDPSQQNIIDITAYNSKELLASPPFRITVDAFGVTTEERPRMHVLAIGVDAYAMKELSLRYATKE